MNIIINGEIRAIPEFYTAAELLAALNLMQQRLALEINQEIVPRSLLATRQFQEGDRVEIVCAIGGG